MLKKVREMYNKTKFSKNTAPKVLSLIFAIVFWIFVMDQVNPEMIREFSDIKVEIVGIEELKSKSYTLMGKRDFTVNVSVKGRRSDILKLTEDNIQIIADIGGISKGTQNIILDKKVNIEDIIITEISKPNVQVVIDEIVRRPINVQIVTKGSVPDGYVSGEMTYFKQQVFVKGPESFVQTVSSIRGLINITNSTSLINEDVAVTAVDSNGEVVTGIEVETNYIPVTIPVLKKKVVIIEPSVDGAPKEGYLVTNVSVTPSDIEIKGESNFVNDLKFIEVLPINTLGASNSFDKNITLDMPKNITLVDNSITTVNVQVTVEKIITTEFVFDIKDIPVLNLNDKLNNNIKDFDGAILLKISAVESVLKNISKDDLALYIDADNVEVGENKLIIKLNKSNDFYKIDIIPNSIKLEINKKNSVNDINDASDETVED